MQPKTASKPYASGQAASRDRAEVAQAFGRPRLLRYALGFFAEGGLG